MNEQGAAAIIGAYASAICLATTQAAAKYNLPHLVDVGVADQIVERGLKNVFRFGPGYRKTTEDAVNDLHTINVLAGKPAKTVMIIHEESLFGTGTANLLAQELPKLGFEVKEVIKHANPTRDFSNIVLRVKTVNPDIIIPANYYNEYALFVRTMKQQGVKAMAIFSVLGGAASRSSSSPSSRTSPTASSTSITGSTRRTRPRSRCARRSMRSRTSIFTYEVFLNYQAVYLLADAIERAKSAKREAIIEALAASTWDEHFMPYGPTRFVNGQNTGAQPMTMQVRDRRHPGRAAEPLRGDGSRYSLGRLTARSARRTCRSRTPRGGSGKGAAVERARSSRRVADSTILLAAFLNGLTPGRRLCADRARSDADLRRPAHHQLRARRGVDGRALRRLLPVHRARHRSVSRPAGHDGRPCSRSATRCSAS